jgi:glycosyltransferase involved in cell wall biosynthesis
VNTSRVWQHCRGEYIAICDSDDIWTDPYKLRNQVKFLDENPSCGAVYSDVEIISATGEIGDNDGYDRIRRQYTSGRIFSQLLKGNFINNSTGVFRKSLIADYKIDEDKSYYSYDYLFWLNIACQSEIHYLNARTTSYRRHSGAATTSDLRLARNREKFLHYLPSLLIKFDECRSGGSLTNEEKVQIFRKKLSVIYRKETDLKMKWKILQLMPRYFPGLRGVISILTAKYRKDDATGDRKRIRLNS